MAFSKAPSPKALGEVNVGGRQKEKYILGDYITLLLNMYIGQGLWDKQVDFIESHDEILTKRRKKKVGGQETNDWEDYQQLVVSATVKVTLIIYDARNPSGPTRKYEAICVGTNFTDPANGRADALDKAIKSAETDGLKRTSKNLGRAFGLDLKEKIKPEALPPKLSQFQADYDAAMARRASGGAVTAPPANTAATQSVPESGSASAPAPATASKSAPTPSPAPAARAETRVEGSPSATPAPAGEVPAEPDAADQPAKMPDMDNAAGKANPAPETAAAPATPRAEPEVAKANAAQAAQPSSDAATADPAGAPRKWDLTMIPQNYEQWLECIKEMGNRLAIMRHATEIENFRKRHSRLIDKLPVLPAEGDRARKDFKSRWTKMVSARYAALGLPEPGGPANNNQAPVQPAHENA